jgi:hypothetical protein
MLKLIHLQLQDLQTQTITTYRYYIIIEIIAKSLFFFLRDGFLEVIHSIDDKVINLAAENGSLLQ